MLGSCKFSSDAIVYHHYHNKSVYCGRYTISVNCCGRRFIAMLIELRNVISVIHVSLQRHTHNCINLSWSVFNLTMEGGS